LIAPQKVANCVGIFLKGKLGFSEVSATYGGILIGLGAARLWFQQSKMYIEVGLTWFLAEVSRTVSLFPDQSFSGKNVGETIIEVDVGLLLVANVRYQ
jgi:hypothetical protein